MTTMRRSSGNVFRDLGFSPKMAENLRVRCELMDKISDLIEDRALTQTDAARMFGVTQPRVSDLVRGKIHLFTIDALIDMLARAGCRVNIRVTRAAS
jgi:predicted XRE-type DNA-binding protein